MNTRLALFCITLFAVAIYSCSVDETALQKVSLELPQTPYSYKIGNNDNIPTLGRVLFYDNQLSTNNSISCASCHKQELAFADNVAFSRGFENRLTTRNSMPIQNIGFALENFAIDSVNFSIDNLVQEFTFLFWDGRESNLQTMVLKPVANHVEMGIRDMNSLPKKLSALPYYKELFKKAYGTEEITTDKIAQSIGIFLRTINSNQSKLDLVMNGSQKLTALENQGQNLFTTIYDCNSCHQVQNAHGYIFAGTFANIGLETEYADKGLQGTSSNERDAGRFKIPSLRNVALTAPYMHDGRFATLDQVLDHYSGGIADNPNLDLRLRDENNRPMRMNIPEADRKAIVAFLNTLTDYKMITDPKLSNPFKAK